MGFPTARTWRELAWNGTVFCAVASGTDQCATSTNGVDWTERTMPASADWRAIAWNGTVFCAVAWGGTVAATSPDGITWTARTLPVSANWIAIAWNGSVFCAVAWGGTVAATSPDGITWTARTLPFTGNWVDVAAKGSILVAIANGSSDFARSIDNGASWTQSAAGGLSWRAINASSSGFVAVATATATGVYSVDGNGFSGIALPSSANWYDLVWGNNTFVAVHDTSGAATGNADGSVWTAQTTPTGGWVAVEWGGTFFCAIETAGTGTVVSSDGITWQTTALVAPEYGTPVAPTTLLMVAIGTAVAPTALTVEHPTGTATAPTTLRMQATGTPMVPTTLVMLPVTHSAKWTAICRIGGVDESAKLVGSASVVGEEGAARIARVTIKPSAGTISPLDYVGKTLTLDYVLDVAGTLVARRVFTGRVDTPFYDPNTTLLTLTCTDDLQNVVAALPRANIDAITGGRYSEAVHGELDDAWDYAQALMSTVKGSLDMAPHGGLRVTPWKIASVWTTFTESELLYQRMELALPQRSTLVNSVSIEFDYRYARLRQRYTTVGWSGTQIDIAPTGWQYPTQQDILGACNGSGWKATQAVFYPAPASIPHNSGGFIRPPAGSIDMAIVHLTQRHAQTVTESYSITVSAPESIAANGELPFAIRGALASSFDGIAWESALDVAPLMDTGGEQDYAPDAPRASAEHAIQTLLDQAEAKILGSHRSARVTNAVLCNPDLDIDKRVVINTAQCQADGKVARVEHVLDFERGSAITEFSIAISGVGGAGILTPDTLSPPARPNQAAETQDWGAAIPSLYVATYGITPYSDSLMGWIVNPAPTITVEDVPGQGTVIFDNPSYVAGSYPVEGFRVRMPGVDDADRNPLTIPVSKSMQIIVPTDTLVFTVP